jgi:hypothetical protein
MGLGFGIRDPGSGKNLFRIMDPGVKKASDPGYGSAALLPTKQGVGKIKTWNKKNTTAFTDAEQDMVPTKQSFSSY